MIWRSTGIARSGFCSLRYFRTCCSSAPASCANNAKQDTRPSSGGPIVEGLLTCHLYHDSELTARSGSGWPQTLSYESRLITRRTRQPPPRLSVVKESTGVQRQWRFRLCKSEPDSSILVACYHAGWNGRYLACRLSVGWKSDLGIRHGTVVPDGQWGCREALLSERAGPASQMA